MKSATKIEATEKEEKDKERFGGRFRVKIVHA